METQLLCIHLWDKSRFCPQHEWKKQVVTYQVVINLVHGIKCRTLLDIGVGSSYISSTIVSKLNKQPVRRGTKKIEMMLYTTNNKLSIYYVTIKNLEDDFKFTKETNAINKDALLNMPNPDYGRVQNMEEYKISPPHRNQDEWESNKSNTPNTCHLTLPRANLLFCRSLLNMH